MVYFIDVKPKVYKFILSLENSKHIFEKLKLLKNFRNGMKLNLDIKKLRGQDKNIELYRLRVGEIRIIFQIIEKKKIIWVKLADYRGRVYR